MDTLGSGKGDNDALPQIDTEDVIEALTVSDAPDVGDILVSVVVECVNIDVVLALANADAALESLGADDGRAEAEGDNKAVGESVADTDAVAELVKLLLVEDEGELDDERLACELAELELMAVT